MFPRRRWKLCAICVSDGDDFRFDFTWHWRLNSSQFAHSTHSNNSKQFSRDSSSIRESNACRCGCCFGALPKWRKLEYECVIIYILYVALRHAAGWRWCVDSIEKSNFVASIVEPRPRERGSRWKWKDADADATIIIYKFQFTYDAAIAATTSFRSVKIYDSSQNSPYACVGVLVLESRTVAFLKYYNNYNKL